MRAPQLCLQNVIAGDALILRKAPPAVHPADRRVVAGEVLLQPRKLPLRFYIVANGIGPTDTVKYTSIILP